MWPKSLPSQPTQRPQRVAARRELGRPLRFDEYQQRALYGEHGFYTAVGQAGRGLISSRQAGVVQHDHRHRQRPLVPVGRRHLAMDEPAVHHRAMLTPPAKPAEADKVCEPTAAELAKAVTPVLFAMVMVVAEAIVETYHPAPAAMPGPVMG